MSNNTSLLTFEKSAYKFIEELKNIRTDIQLLPASEAKKASKLVSCVQSMMSCVNKDIEEKN